MNTGDDNDPLTEKWRQQAQLAGQKIKDSWIWFDLIISSNLDRAIETGKIIGSEIWYSWEYLVDKRLREQDGWVFMGRSRDEIKKEYSIENDCDFRKLFRDKKYNQVESPEEFTKRVAEALDYLNSAYTGKNILIVAHSGTARPLAHLIHWVDIDYALYEMKWLPNAKLVDLEDDKNYKKIEAIN